MNAASRMESTGIAGSVQITDATYQLVHTTLTCEERGMVDVKGKGQMRTWRVVK